MTIPSFDLKRRSIEPWRSRPVQARQAPSGHRDVRPAMRVVRMPKQRIIQFSAETLSSARHYEVDVLLQRHDNVLIKLAIT